MILKATVCVEVEHYLTPDKEFRVAEALYRALEYSTANEALSTALEAAIGENFERVRLTLIKHDALGGDR